MRGMRETSRPALGSTQPLIQYVPGFCPQLKRPERDNDNASSSSAEVRNEWKLTSIPPVWLHDVYTYNFTLSCYNINTSCSKNTYMETNAIYALFCGVTP